MAGIKQIGVSSKSRAPRKRKPKAHQDLWLNELLDEYLTGTMTPPRNGVFHPSILSNVCDRAVWLTYHGKMVSSILVPKVKRIFQNGDYLEKRVESWFYGLGILLAREKPLKMETPPISGRMDFLIKHQNYGILPVELKSINTSGFSRLTRPKTEHQIQLQIYLNMGNYNVGTVLYENKNDQDIKSFLVERDAVQWNDILERCFYIQNLESPPSKCTGASWCACRKVEYGK